MDYPFLLRPTAVEPLRLPSGRNVHVPKASPIFQRWDGVPVEDTYGRKPILKIDGEPAFAELVILKLFQHYGWNGVWVDSYRRKYRIGYPSDKSTVELPMEQEAILNKIYRRAGSRGGCFDVYCWDENDNMFVESKYSGHDKIRNTQLRWLEGALEEGFPLDSFLVVEWSTRD